jgi:ectoine hydroxylase-related dioxygenase (phytanoyl-CoA dioxygenase family)
MNQLSELDRTGYTVVRGFLDEETCDKFTHEFESQPGVENRNYIARPVGEDGINLFYPIFKEKGQAALKDSLYSCDMLAWGDYFSIKDGVNAKWHLDHETYFFWQNHFNSYNFYIPIVKPDPRKSNLSVIPIDRLQNEIPSVANALVGKGARMLIQIDGRWVVYDEENCRISETVQPEAIDRMSVTPELARGDLLIARGDVFHKTQDTSTYRVALSIRAVSSSSLITKDRLLSGGASKLCYLTEARSAYSMILNLFENYGTNELESKVLTDVIRVKDKGIMRMPSEEEFISRIVAERTPLDRKRLRIQAKSLQTYERREHFRRFASIIERVA